MNAHYLIGTLFVLMIFLSGYLLGQYKKPSFLLNPTETLSNLAIIVSAKKLVGGGTQANSYREGYDQACEEILKHIYRLLAIEDHGY